MIVESLKSCYFCIFFGLGSHTINYADCTCTYMQLWPIVIPCAIWATKSDVHDKMAEGMMTLLVYMNVCETLLIVSGDVELNPSPSKTCPKFKKYFPKRTIVCSFAGYIMLLESKS